MKRRLTMTVPVIGIIALVLAFMFQATAFCEDANKEIVAEAQKITNDKQPFTISISTADKKDTYKVGDEIAFTFSANKDCYLYIIDIGTSGKTHLLFPNKLQKENKIATGKTYVLPPKSSDVVFRVKAPEGTNYIKAIATEKPIKSLKKGEELQAQFAELANPTQTFKDISAELAPKNNWASAEFAVKVTK